MTQIDLLRANSVTVNCMIQEGESYQKVGDKFGVSKSVVADYCKKNNLSHGALHNDIEDVSRKVKEKTGGRLEYVSGYSNKSGDITVRCTVCLNEFNRTYHNITTKKGDPSCPYCVSLERRKAKKKKQSDRNIRTALAESNKFYRGSNQVIAKQCEICGGLFITTKAKQKYCSEPCRKIAIGYDNSGDDRINPDVLIDKDIALDKLYERDGGICWLCGCSCDWSDCTTTNAGVFIAGNNYPSKDHVIPLAKGGLHAWSNIRLAHRRCNSLKGSKIIKR